MKIFLLIITFLISTSWSAEHLADAVKLPIDNQGTLKQFSLSEITPLAKKLTRLCYSPNKQKQAAFKLLYNMTLKCAELSCPNIESLHNILTAEQLIKKDENSYIFTSDAIAPYLKGRVEIQNSWIQLNVHTHDITHKLPSGAYVFLYNGEIYKKDLWDLGHGLYKAWKEKYLNELNTFIEAGKQRSVVAFCVKELPGGNKVVDQKNIPLEGLGVVLEQLKKTDECNVPFHIFTHIHSQNI
jgi:hypothetical protein